jgi:hypothetical protein
LGFIVDRFSLTDGKKPVFFQGIGHIKNRGRRWMVVKTKAVEPSLVEADVEADVETETEETSPVSEPAPTVVSAPVADELPDAQNLDGLFSALKTLLSTVEKLQKARQEVGDIKPLMGRLLDGELLSGEDLEQLKVGVNNLSKLVKVYADYQVALQSAQPARSLLDSVLKS